MFKKAMSLVLAATAGVAMLTACGGGGGNDVGYGAWYDVYGRRCGATPGPGCNFYSNGYKIIDTEDPFFKNYVLKYDSYGYTDSYGRYQTYIGWGWRSQTGILYNDFGDALNNTDGQGRDHVADVAEAQAAADESAAKYLQEKYGVTASAGREIAAFVDAWAKIGKTRARTDADYAAASRVLAGQDLGKVQAALQDAMLGDKAAVNGIVADQAKAWGTSPELVKEMYSNFIGEKLAKSVF